MSVASPLKHRLFTQFFPPPKFLEMPAVGLDISDDAISALELVRQKGALRIGRFNRRSLPPGSIQGGYVNDRNAVVGELRKLKDALKLDFVRASISEEKAYLFKTKIPRVSQKEMREAVEFKLEENVPIPAKDAVFDYAVIAQRGHDAADHFDIAVAVVPQKVVETYTEILESAGLAPLSFEIEAQAISRAVVSRGDTDTYLVVNFGESKTGLFIVSDEMVHFTSTVGIGGAHITEAIAKHLSISVDEAAKIKHEHAAFKDKRNIDLFLSLMNAISVLKDEISKLSVYWNTHKDSDGELGKKITKVILCGRDAGFTGLADYLSLTFENTVEVSNVWRNAFSFEDCIPPISFDESLDYAAAIGLALPKGH